MRQTLLSLLIVVVSSAALSQNCPDGSYCGQTSTSSPQATKQQAAEIKCPSPESEVVLHSSATAALPVVDILRCGEQVSVLEKQAGWFRVRTNAAKEGYVQAAFVSQVASMPPATTPLDRTPVAFASAFTRAFANAFQSCPAGTFRIPTSYGSYCGTPGEPVTASVQSARNNQSRTTTRVVNTETAQKDLTYTDPRNAQGRITVRVVNTSTAQQHTSYTYPGSPETSKTYCNSDSRATAINLGGMTTANGSGTTNCTTTTTPATPPTTVDVAGAWQAYVRAVMPDGAHVTLWCQKEFRDCRVLAAGDYFAEVKGEAVWIHTADRSGKEHKIKYRSVGSTLRMQGKGVRVLAQSFSSK